MLWLTRKSLQLFCTPKCQRRRKEIWRCVLMVAWYFTTLILLAKHMFNLTLCNRPSVWGKGREQLVFWMPAGLSSMQCCVSCVGQGTTLKASMSQKSQPGSIWQGAWTLLTKLGSCSSLAVCVRLTTWRQAQPLLLCFRRNQNKFWCLITWSLLRAKHLKKSIQVP